MHWKTKDQENRKEGKEELFTTSHEEDWIGAGEVEVVGGRKDGGRGEGGGREAEGRQEEGKSNERECM